jgi:hypothetical protein
MAVAPKLEPGAPQEASPAPRPQERHLRLVPRAHAPVDDEARRVSQARWVTAFVAVLTAALLGVWTAAVLGAADAAWWPAVLGAVFVVAVAFGVVVVRRTR